MSNKDPKKHAENQARWREANPERAAEIAAKSHRENLESRKASQAQYRKENKEKRAVYDVRRSIERKEVYHAFIDRYKLKDGCSTCGQNDDPRKLHCHHVDSKTKLFNIGDGYSYTHASVIRELAKCVVLCNGCHSKLLKGRTRK